MKSVTRLWRWPAQALAGLLILAILVYQKTLSPLFGPACRFEIGRAHV